jgi:hypothetical protein
MTLASLSEICKRLDSQSFITSALLYTPFIWHCQGATLRAKRDNPDSNTLTFCFLFWSQLESI